MKNFFTILFAGIVTVGLFILSALFTAAPFIIIILLVKYLFF